MSLDNCNKTILRLFKICIYMLVKIFLLTELEKCEQWSTKCRDNIVQKRVFLFAI